MNFLTKIQEAFIPTVESAVTHFHTAIQQLEQAKEFQLFKAKLHSERAALAQEASDLARKEAERAHNISEKLRELVGL